MKFLGLVLIGMFVFSSVLFAAEEDYTFSKFMTSIKMQDLKQGVGYSFIENKFNYMFTKEGLKYKGFTAEYGFNSTDKIVGVLSYQLIALKDYIDAPIIDWLELNLGLYGGWGRIQVGGGMSDNNIWDAGASITLIKMKW
jgi:hypothetical protein